MAFTESLILPEKGNFPSSPTAAPVPRIPAILVAQRVNLVKCLLRDDRVKGHLPNCFA